MEAKVRYDQTERVSGLFWIFFSRTPRRTSYMLVRKGVDEERNLYRFVRQRLLSTILPLGAGGDDFGKGSRFIQSCNENSIC